MQEISGFNPQPARTLHLDINSCFATIEQQANPALRGKPIAVAAYTSASGCILAPSVEAKRLGIKTGMRVKEGKLLCPDLIVLTPDPPKYRAIHLQLKKLLGFYAPEVFPKSIDEFVFEPPFGNPRKIAVEIKKRIKKEIGDYLTVSIGIGPNRFLAKLASSLHKPDGLDEINKDNFLDLYSRLRLVDLCGIKARNAVRLNSAGIYTVMDFYRASLLQLKSAFSSICGYYWYKRLHGYEIDAFVSKKNCFGNSFALPRPFQSIEELAPILTKLVQKAGFRLRQAGYSGRGVHLAVFFRNGAFWHQGHLSKKILYDSREIYQLAFRLLNICPLQSPVRELAVSIFGLVKKAPLQLEIFGNVLKKDSLVKAMDKVNQRWGNFVVFPAKMLGTEKLVPDRIAFGSPA